MKTSRKQLERFEELGLFYPVARARHPVVKRKIEYSDDGNSYLDQQSGCEFSSSTRLELEPVGC